MPNLRRVYEPTPTILNDYPTLRKFPIPENVPPYIIMLFTEESKICTGSIITPDLVLTTATCLEIKIKKKNQKFIAVKLSSSFTRYLTKRLKIPFEESVIMDDVEERRSVEYYLHPQYVARIQDIDIALLRMNNPFSIQKHELPTINTKKVKELTNCTTYYFAFNSTTKKLSTHLNVRKDFKVILWHFLAVPSMFCYDLGQSKMKTNICPGVSGSPLISQNEIWGIASFPFSIYECGEIYFYCYLNFFAANKWLRKYLSI